MSEKNFVSYEEFGAVGDGKTNDFAAIMAAHNYANENRLPVKTDSSKTYYICDTRIDGVVKQIIVKTSRCAALPALAALTEFIFIARTGRLLKTVSLGRAMIASQVST